MLSKRKTERKKRDIPSFPGIVVTAAHFGALPAEVSRQPFPCELINPAWLPSDLVRGEIGMLDGILEGKA